MAPLAQSPLSVPTAVAVLKAMAEPTRLRVLALLAHGELNVKDLTRVLGQSQPRISRHLKLLAEAGLVARAPEGSWVYFRLADQHGGSELATLVLGAADSNDPVLLRDRARAEALRAEREALAQAYFQAHAKEWDSIRALHVAEASVEAAISAAVGTEPSAFLIDLGTGTGRMLELLAERYRRGLGIDRSPAMLAYARAKLERAKLTHAQVRQGDIYDLPLGDAVADAVIMHQVMHFLADPVQAIREAARVLKPAGRLIIVDFAPHELEYLRDQFAHERLGFSESQVAQWLAECGLDLLERRELKPASSGKRAQLTVAIWLARRPASGVAVADGMGQHNLERVS
jgi:ubiquinone/menaquinone biosynthesis C-methylase UbiE/DNA-binding transcriptional ArsR family regulator